MAFFFFFNNFHTIRFLFIRNWLSAFLASGNFLLGPKRPQEDQLDAPGAEGWQGTTAAAQNLHCSGWCGGHETARKAHSTGFSDTLGIADSDLQVHGS